MLFIAALLAFRAQRSSLRRDVSAADSELAGAIGVNLSASELADPDLAGILARLDQAGVRWVRFVLPWDEIEPARGQARWERFDRVFELLRAQPRLNPVVVLNGSPAWARRPGDVAKPLAPPQERADFGAFAAAVARRYSDQVRYYQVWDQPNIAPHWGARPVNPADYLGLLREAAVQIRSTDDDAQIVLAALAPNTEAGGANLSDIAFLEALYTQGARPWFDVVAAQPYGFSAPPDAPASAGALNFGRASLLRDVMARHGDGAKRLWATAFGWNALPANWTGQPSPWGQVDGATQVRYTGQATELASRRWSWLGPLFWPAVCPQLASDDPWRGFALCAEDGSAKPVANALAVAAKPPGVLPPGDHAVDHPALRYDPGWRVTSAAADPGADGDALTYDFVGTETALRVQGGPYWAYYLVTVDGQPANALPRDESGVSYAVLYDPLGEERLIPLAEDLAPGRHQVRVEARGGWGQWALRGIRVADGAAGASRLPHWQRLLLAAALVVVICLILARPELKRGARWLAARLYAPVQLPDAAWWGAAALLAFVLGLSRWLILDLATLAALGLIFFIRPDVSLPLIAFTIPLWPRPKTLAGLEFSLYELLLWLAIGAALARWLVSRAADALPRRLRLQIHGLDWSVLSLLVVGLAATLAAERSNVAVREFRTVFLTGALFYALVTRARWPSGRAFSARPLVVGLLLGMSFVSLIALWQFATGQGRIDVEGVGRVRAFYGSPNNLALVLDRVVPIGLALAAFSAFRAPRSVERLFYALATLIMAAACVITYSKGALLLGLPVGVATVLLAGAWRSRKRWPIWSLAALFFSGVLGLLALTRTPRFADLTKLTSGTGFFRVKLWQSAWRMALDHPALGVGPDNFLYAYRTRYVLPSAWQELNLSHPHNLILDLATRLGVLGILAGAWAMIGGLLSGWRLLRSGGADVWPLVLGLLGGLAATIAHGLIDNSLFLIDLMALFMLTLGLLQRLSDAADGE
jgi:O-antigen ligase